MFKSRWKRVALALAIIVAGTAFLGIKNGLWEPFKALPEIAQGLPHDEAAANEEFNKRITEQFKDVKNVAELVGQLTFMGFTVEPTGNVAIFSKTMAPCVEQWLVGWQSLEGQVVSPQGHYREICVGISDLLEAGSRGEGADGKGAGG